MISTFCVGLLAGGIHVVTGIDHLAAIAPLALDRPKRSWMIGIRWGLGHASGVGLAFLAVLAFRSLFNLETLSAWSERAVGLTLIAIGVLGARNAMKARLHTHAHEHDGAQHQHIHFHAHASAHVHPVHEESRKSHARDEHAAETGGHPHRHTALGVGLLHGMAGSSHLFGILPALLLPTKADAFFYMAAFGLGTLCSMGLVSFALGQLALKFQRSHAIIFERALLAACGFTIVLGGVWLAAV